MSRFSRQGRSRGANASRLQVRRRASSTGELADAVHMSEYDRKIAELKRSLRALVGSSRIGTDSSNSLAPATESQV
jgi:hypothetical protein